MTRRQPDLVREAVIALAERGHVADVDLSGAGHFKVRWIANGRRHLLVVSRTPSDRRSAANARALLRRLLHAEDRP